MPAGASIVTSPSAHGTDAAIGSPPPGSSSSMITRCGSPHASGSHAMIARTDDVLADDVLADDGAGDDAAPDESDPSTHAPNSDQKAIVASVVDASQPDTDHRVECCMRARIAS